MHDLSENTIAILLLCTNWSRSSDAAKSLSAHEFNCVMEWLESGKNEPADLVGSKEVLERYQKQPLPGIEPGRLADLLDSGAGMSIQVEQWLNNGLWVLSLKDDDYPERLKTVLKKHAPPILYGYGPTGLVSKGGIAVVGSRDVDEKRASIAETLSSSAAENGISIISGGARGVDQIAMQAAFSSGGAVVGVLAGDLGRVALKGFMRDSIEMGNAALVSPYRPDAGFSVGNAMGRNRYIYALSDVAVVVSASNGKGGTWAGAVENLDKWHVPLYVVDQPDLPGNIQLIKKGGMPLPSEALLNPAVLIPDPTLKDEAEHPGKDDSAGTPVQLPLFNLKVDKHM